MDPQGPRPAARRLLLRATPEERAPLARPGSTELAETVLAGGRYDVVGEIARGGVGAVFAARDRELGRDVAIKVLRREHARNGSLVARFMEEAQVGSQLQHPGIVPVYELGVFPDGRPFLAMKLVKGETLAALLAARRSPADDRARFVGIFARICQTMAYAHARGVIHRDLKPSNVMVGAFGEVQVMDWGLSKVMAAGAPEPVAEGPVSTIRTGRTGSESLVGSVMGTPSFMPPEQARGEVESLDERADVFSLGAILCEILTGEPPYTGEDARAVRDAAERGDLAAAFERIEASPFDAELKRLARACLAPEKKARPRDAARLERGIEAHLAAAEERVRAAELESAAATARAAEEARARRLTLALAGAIVLALVIAGGAYVIRQSEKAASERSLAERVDRSLDAASGLRGEARAAAGGDLVAWEKALAAADGAMALVADASAPAALRERAETVRREIAAEAFAARERAERDECDATMAALVEEIRTDVGLTWNRASAECEERFTRAFRDYGIDLDALEPDEAARRIRESAVAPALLGCLHVFGYVREETLGLDHARTRRLEAVARAAKTDPLHAEVLRVGTERDLEGARALAASLDPSATPAGAICELAVTLKILGDLEASFRLLRRAILYRPGDYWLQFDLAMRALGFAPPRTGDAIPALTAAIAIRPNSAPAWITLGQTYDLQDEPESALVPIRRAIELRPDIAVAHSSLGVSLSRLGRVVEAEAAFREAARLAPDDTIARANWADVLSIGGRQDEAIAMAREAVERSPAGAIERALLAGILYRAGRPAEAVDAAREAIRLDPSHATAFDTVGLGLGALGDFAGAAEAFGRLAELQPRSAVVRMNHGLALTRLERWRDAAAAFESAIRIEPRMAENHNELGLCLGKLGLPEAAIEEYRQAIRLGPEQPHAYVNLADVLALRGEWTAALRSMRVGYELSLRAPDFTGSLREALDWFVVAAAVTAPFAEILTGERAPASADERLGLAFLLRRAGRADAAVREYEAAFAAAPDRAADLFAGERLEAARAAAAAGRIDRALDWLEADLSEWRSLAETGSPPLRHLALRTIDSWRKDAALAPLRDADRSERAGRFWAAVDVALAPPAKR